MNAHLAFLVSQAAHIENEVYKIEYPDHNYRELVPVDTSAAPFAGSVEYFSMDSRGELKLLGQRATDFPLIETMRSKHSVRIEDAGIGYDYTMSEIGLAMKLGIDLSTDKAAEARRIAEEGVYKFVIDGFSGAGWDSLTNSSLVHKSDAPNDGTGSSREWAKKTADQVIRDFNNCVTGVWSDSKNVEMADTVLLPDTAWAHIANTPRSANSDMSILMWLQRNNTYTARTGQPLRIRELRGLEDAAASSEGRMIAYRRDPRVLRLHMPMPLRFLAPQLWLTRYVVPGMLRLGGLEIRKPGAMRYLDGITA